MKNINSLLSAFLIASLFSCGDSLELNTSLKVNEGDAVEIVSGPMIGHVSMRSIDVWAQVEGSSNLSLKVWNENGEIFSEQIEAGSRTAYSSVLQVGDLDPGTEYSAVVLSNGTPVGDTLSVSTQVLWDYRTDPPSFKLLAGSCAFINDSLYDRQTRETIWR